MDNSELEFYGPVIVGNERNSQKHPNFFQSNQKIIENFGIDTYQKTNINSTNDLTTFGNISHNNKKNKLKYYKKFLYKNRNNYHSLSEEHLNNLVKFLNKKEFPETDIPKSFKVMTKNKPLYPSNNF